MRVTPGGDFALGCNTFMVAGWNQLRLLEGGMMHLPGRALLRPWRTHAEVAYVPAAQQSASSCAARAQRGQPQPALQTSHIMALKMTCSKSHSLLCDAVAHACAC